MNAVSPHLLAAIKTLQSLPSMQHAALGGGTNLALRYNHRSDKIGRLRSSRMLSDRFDLYPA